MAADATGHEHKGKGQGGGQFVSKGGGGGDSADKVPEAQRRKDIGLDDEDDPGDPYNPGITSWLVGGPKVVNKLREWSDRILDNIPGHKLLRKKTNQLKHFMVDRYGENTTGLAITAAQTMSLGTSYGTVPTAAFLLPMVILGEMKKQTVGHIGLSTDTGSKPKASKDQVDKIAKALLKNIGRLIAEAMNGSEDTSETDSDAPLSMGYNVLIEKEVIAPGDYWYIDQKTGVPRKLSVTSQHTKYWQEQGKSMLDTGLQVPVPYEHDFNVHPMSSKDALLNNAGDVKEYRLKDFDDPIRGKVKDALFSVVEVKDRRAREKIKDGSIRWTSPWINSFTDGNGKTWNNVITHLALTTRPRVTPQQPFGSVAAALSMASEARIDVAKATGVPEGGLCLSRAGLLLQGMPAYPLAFSIYSGAALADFPPKKDKSKPKPGGDMGGGDKPPPPKDGGGDKPPMPGADGGEGDETGADGLPGTGDDNMIDMPPLGDKAGDVSMEEVLCDLLRALGVDCTHDGDEAQFKRNLYAAAMKKVHDLTSKGMGKEEDPKPGAINQGKPPGSPGMGGAQPNPLVQQEQQPMYMGDNMTTPVALSLEDINKLPDPMRGFALSMYAENQRIRAEAEVDRKKLNALNDSKLKEESLKRQQRIAMISRVSPKVKADLEAMMALPHMALSMGDGGTVVDPMHQTLAVLEKGLSDLPTLLKVESSALGVAAQPRDGDELSQEEMDKAAESFSRSMGNLPEKKAS